MFHKAWTSLKCNVDDICTEYDFIGVQARLMKEMLRLCGGGPYTPKQLVKLRKMCGDFIITKIKKGKWI